MLNLSYILTILRRKDFVGIDSKDKVIDYNQLLRNTLKFWPAFFYFTAFQTGFTIL
jgi:hypothetical protein